MKKNIWYSFFFLLAVSFGFRGGKILAFESHNVHLNRFVCSEHTDIQSLQDENRESSTISVFEERLRRALEEEQFFIAGIDSKDGALQRLIDVCQPFRDFLEEHNYMMAPKEECSPGHYLHQCLQGCFEDREYELPLIMIVPHGPFMLLVPYGCPIFFLELGDIQGMSSEELICLGEAIVASECFQNPGLFYKKNF